MRECPDPAAPPEWRSRFSCALHDKHQVDTHRLLPPPHPVTHDHVQEVACSGSHGECSVSGCCQSASYTCYEHGQHFAMCLPTGSCRDFWPAGAHASCEVKERSTTCAAPGGDCAQSQCCSDADHTCFQKDAISHEAKCMRGCGTGVDGAWDCTVIDKTKRGTSPPPPPPPPPMPLYYPTYMMTCADFERRTSIHSRSCSELTNPVSCNAHFREPPGRAPMTPFAHVLEPCTWITVGRLADNCAQGDPLECTPAMISG